MRLVTRLSLALLALLTIGGGVVAGVAGSVRPSTHLTSRRVIDASGYELDDTAVEMVRFPDNADIVQGHVLSAGAARWNTQSGTAPDPSQGQSGLYYIYTPMSVAIDAVLKGSDQSAGQVITVRRYGGEVDGTVLSLENNSTALLQTSEQVVVFLQAPHELNDGSADRVANAVYSLTPDGMLMNVEHVLRGTVGQLLALIGSNGDLPSFAPQART
jgi:hypothetical protein